MSRDLSTFKAPLSDEQKRWLTDFNKGHLIEAIEADAKKASRQERAEKREAAAGAPNYEDLSLKELQEEAEKRDLPTYGKKADIIARLEESGTE